MSYLTSGFISLSKTLKLMPFKSKSDKGPFYGKSALSKKSTPKVCLSNLKHFKQEHLQEQKQNEKQSKANKTPPLVLFINLLMKHGKKTNALRVLSMTLSLFKARISKVKLQKHKNTNTNAQGSFKNSKKSEYKVIAKGNKNYQYFDNQAKMTLQGNSWLFFSSKTKKKVANYSIKAPSLSVIFSKKKSSRSLPLATGLRPFGKKGFNLLLNVTFPWYLNYRTPFPFIFNFSKVFDLFYTKKSFFCGRFWDLKQHPLIKKKTQVRPTTLLSSSPFSLFSKKKNEGNICVWYKKLAKKKDNSWAKLTTPQKNTFLFCLYKAISNVKPPLECRTKRIGGSNKQIPSQVSEHRQWGIAIRWIIEVAEKEFSKKKNKINLGDFRPINQSILNNISKSSGNNQDQFKFPRGLAVPTKKTLQSKQSQLGSWALDEKTKFLSSLKQRKAKAGGLKVFSSKTRLLKAFPFCFFLAESLENAYYKTGPAMQKRNLWVETALANRAFLRYRWW